MQVLVVRQTLQESGIDGDTRIEQRELPIRTTLAMIQQEVRKVGFGKNPETARVAHQVFFGFAADYPDSRAI